jgi:hypothetical protein
VKVLALLVDIREVIGMKIIDEHAGKAYTLLDVMWDGNTQAPVLKLEEVEE